MRQALSILIPLLAPTLLYLYFKSRSGTPALVAAKNAPWIWLSAGGIALATLILTVVALTSGAPAGSDYRPPRVVDGKVVPGELSPKSDSKPEGAAKP